MSFVQERRTADFCFSDFAMQLERALKKSPFLPLRTLICERQGDSLVIRGHVPTFYLKQLLQALVKQSCSADHVRDEVAVIGPGERKPVASSS